MQTTQKTDVTQEPSTAVQITANPAKPGPVELTVEALKQVGGGVSPNGTWLKTNSPNGTW